VAAFTKKYAAAIAQGVFATSYFPAMLFSSQIFRIYDMIKSPKPQNAHVRRREEIGGQGHKARDGPSAC